MTLQADINAAAAGATISGTGTQGPVDIGGRQVTVAGDGTLVIDGGGSKNPIRIHGADRLPAAISSRLGANTDEVLSSMLDMSEPEIATLRSEGVIGPRPSST